MADCDSPGLPQAGKTGRFCLLFAEDAIRLLYGDGIPTTGYRVKAPSKRRRLSSGVGAPGDPDSKVTPPKSGGGAGHGGLGVRKTCSKCRGPLIGHKKGQACPLQANATV